MKLVFDRYEVEITARDVYLHDTPNGWDTMACLINLSNLAWEARDSLRGKGLDALAEEANRVGREIWAFTREQGGLEAFEGEKE